MPVWWYLGEVLNWCHVIFMMTVIILGFLWMRPVWIWPLFLLGMNLSWQVFGGCPLTMLGDWLQSRHGDNFHMSFDQIYGPALGSVIVFILFVVGIVLAFWLTKRATGPFVSRAFDEKHRDDFGFN